MRLLIYSIKCWHWQLDKAILSQREWCLQNFGQSDVTFLLQSGTSILPVRNQRLKELGLLHFVRSHAPHPSVTRVLLRTNQKPALNKLLDFTDFLPNLYSDFDSRQPSRIKLLDIPCPDIGVYEHFKVFECFFLFTSMLVCILSWCCV